MGYRGRVKHWVTQKPPPHSSMRPVVIITMVELASLLTAMKSLKKMAGSSSNCHLVGCCKNQETFTARFKDLQLQGAVRWHSDPRFLLYRTAPLQRTLKVLRWQVSFAKVRAFIRKERDIPGINTGSWSPVPLNALGSRSAHP